MTKRKYNYFVICACWAALLTIATVSYCTQTKGDEAPATSAAESTRIVSPYATEEADTTAAEPAEQTTEAETTAAPAETTEADTTEAATEAVTAVETEAEYISLGEYKLTAYCACEKCCGAWAKNRPVDKDGKPIVYTASMAEAKQGVTVSADTSVHPFGTVLLINGNEYTVQDRGSGVKGKHIDIFFESHEEARQFGLQYKEIFMRGGQAYVD